MNTTDDFRPQPQPSSALEGDLGKLAENKKQWVQTSLQERVNLLERLSQSFLEVFDRLVAAGIAYKRTAADAHARGQEWDSGPLEIVRLLAALRQSLLDTERHGAPRAAGRVREQRGVQGVQTVVPVFPRTLYDRIGMMNARAEVRLKPGIAPTDLPDTQARAYRAKGDGSVALVLGAGNVASIPVTDTLEQLFVHDRVVLLKLNPVNAYLEPFIREGFGPLLEAGVVRVVTGDAEVGSYLCRRPLVEHVHLTGSGETFDSVVFGAGDEGRVRKAQRRPLLGKSVTAELGDISPVIVVPGPWSAGDIRYQARHLATILTHNAGFNCATPRLVVQHRDWPQRQLLLGALASALECVPTRFAYYPGASERLEHFLERHAEVRQLGRPREGELPWTLLEDADPASDSPAFEKEPFCSFVAGIALPGADAAAFLEQAVEFVNERLWGNLSATLLVHPASLRDAAVKEAVELAVDTLRYGTVGVNIGTGFSWSFGVAPWGGYPGNDLYDVRSGIGFVHNPLMLEHIEKTVAYAPFRLYPDAPWFSTNKRYDAATRQLTLLAARPNAGRLLALGGSVLRGWM